MNVERGFARQENTDINHETEDQMRDFDVDEFIKIVNILDSNAVDFSIKGKDILNKHIVGGRLRIRELLDEHDRILEKSTADTKFLGEISRIAKDIEALLDIEW
ncbi:MAG: hypothetical protein Q7S10_03240 [bacterium]|nr:hypothetical protein [bacterium]